MGRVSATGMLTAIAFSAAAMMAFELFLVYRIWIAAREYERTLGEVQEKSQAVQRREGGARGLVLSGGN